VYLFGIERAHLSGRAHEEKDSLQFSMKDRELSVVTVQIRLVI